MRNASRRESLDGRMHAMAATQHGVLTRRELLDIGYSPAALSRRVQEGALVRIRPQVYRVRAVKPSWLQEMYAVCRWLEPSVVASHRSAAVVWNLGDIPPGIFEVTVAEATRQAADVRVHVTDQMPRSHRRVRQLVPVTDPARTVIDCCGVMSEKAALAVIDDACHAQLTTPDHLLHRIEELAARGRNGVGLARKLVRQRIDNDEAPESRLTRMLLRLIQASTLPNPMSLVPVTLPNGVTIHPDLGYPSLKIAIEADGWKEHGKPAGWQGDRHRDNPLQTLGWIVLRFT